MVSEHAAPTEGACIAFRIPVALALCRRPELTNWSNCDACSAYLIAHTHSNDAREFDQLRTTRE